MFIYNTPDFVKYTLDDEEYIVKSNCHKDELIIVLHSVVNNNLKASLLKAMKYEY